MPRAPALGVNAPQYAVDFADGVCSPDGVAAFTRLAEELGLDSVWLSDHPFVIGPDGAASGALEPLTLLSFLARTTARIRLGTLVLATSMRAPALVAAAGRTLGSSRVTIGLGAGWYAPEHAAFGVRLPVYGDRVAALAATAESLRSSRGEILVGGAGTGVLRVAARFADAWNLAWDPPPDTFRALSAKLDRFCREVGRDPREVRRSVGVTVFVADDEAALGVAVERLRRRAPFLRTISLDGIVARAISGGPEECAERLAAYGADEVIVTLGLRDDPSMLRLLATRVAAALGTERGGPFP